MRCASASAPCASRAARFAPSAPTTWPACSSTPPSTATSRSSSTTASASNPSRKTCSSNRRKDILGSLYRTRRDLTAFRRAVLPLREALLHLQRDAEAAISTRARLHLRDTLDHTAQVLDLNDDYSDLTAQLVEMHLSLTARKTNEVIRVLTLVTAIFIPLTFIAGVYGMNFDRSHPANMPELGWSLGYPFFWGLCLVTTGVLVAIFYRLGWLRR